MALFKSEKSFNKSLNTVLGDIDNLRDAIQILCLSAFAMADQHGNLTPLSNLIHRTKGKRAINTKLLSKFIFDHVDNIVWSKDTPNTLEAAKDATGKKLKIMVASVVSGYWDEHDADVAVKKASKLGKVSIESQKTKISDFRDRVVVTTDSQALDNNIDVLKAQLMILEARKKALAAPVVVSKAA